jgi:hypothetical protein
MKKVWITSLSKKIDQQKIMTTLGTYGLGREGHYWTDDVKNAAWLLPLSNLTSEEVGVWLIIATEPEFSKPSVRYGLSLLALSLHNARGHGFPVVIASAGPPPAAESLPTPFRGAELLSIEDATLWPKLVAKVHSQPPAVSTDYRLQLHPMPMGVLFEVGPISGEWGGAIFGVRGEKVEISAQAVGPRQSPPETSKLEYPMKDIKLDLGEEELNAWAVKNTIGEGTSYYAQVLDIPEVVLFGPFPASTDPEAKDEELESFVLRLV